MSLVFGRALPCARNGAAAAAAAGGGSSPSPAGGGLGAEEEALPLCTGARSIFENLCLSAPAYEDGSTHVPHAALTARDVLQGLEGTELVEANKGFVSVFYGRARADRPVCSRHAVVPVYVRVNIV